MASLKLAPDGLKSIQPYLKIAEEHERRDPAITYWCRLYAVQTGLKLNCKAPEVSTFLIKLMDWLESNKKSRANDETITNDVVAQAHLENYAYKLFMYADNEDRCARFNKNVVKAFYTAGFLYDVVNTFGEASEEVLHHRKYAKWKSTYIHNCLKNGETPVPGPVAMEGEFDGDEFAFGGATEPQTNCQDSKPQVPYPTGGLFNNVPGFNTQDLNLPIPGSQAPPSTPSGSSSHINLPSTATDTEDYSEERSTGGASLRPEDFHKAQKYCKWAGSAIQYEDIPTAVENLQKALKLLTTGQDS